MFLGQEHGFRGGLVLNFDRYRRSPWQQKLLHSPAGVVNDVFYRRTG